MEIIRNFTVKISLNNASEQLNPNKKELVYDKLEEKYVNKCYQKSLILKIVEVLEYSNCVFNNNDLGLNSFINVSFSAETYSINTGDYIGNLELSKKMSEKIILNNSRIKGGATIEDINDYKVGMIIPCKVNGSVYLPSSNIQTALEVINLSTIFDTELSNVKIIKPLTDEEFNIIKKYIKICFETTNHIEGKNTKMVKFFTELFTPYKKNINLKDKKVKINDDLSSFKNDKIIKLSFPNTIHRMENYVIESKNEPEKELTSFQFLELVYRDKIRYLNLIHDLVFHFNEKNYDTNSEVWKMLDKTKM